MLEILCTSSLKLPCPYLYLFLQEVQDDQVQQVFTGLQILFLAGIRRWKYLLFCRICNFIINIFIFLDWFLGGADELLYKYLALIFAAFPPVF